ncbi:hypothetical protein BH10PLA2_BH10PLA2_34680 [soil metagenome]
MSVQTAHFSKDAGRYQILGGYWYRLLLGFFSSFIPITSQ